MIKQMQRPLYTHINIYERIYHTISTVRTACTCMQLSAAAKSVPKRDALLSFPFNLSCLSHTVTQRLPRHIHPSLLQNVAAEAKY